MASGDAGRQAPLSPPEFHILLAVADGEKHGYAIMQEVAERTGGRTRLGPGTLYGAVKRLLRAGLIEEADERPDPELDDQRRRSSSRAGSGRSALSAIQPLARKRRITV